MRGFPNFLGGREGGDEAVLRGDMWGDMFSKKNSAAANIY